jgi:hypothetical protein
MSIRHPLRVQTLQMFTALRLMRAGWGGTLVLGVGLREDGRAFALASLAVGAAGLFLEDDPAALRAAQREGCCTFAVTTLDEALRVLKNEVRQRRAITVGLGGDPAVWIAEMVERGVLPGVVAVERSVSIATFEAWGARAVHGLGLARLSDASIDLEGALESATAGRWIVAEETMSTMAARHASDVALEAQYAEDDPIAAAMQAWLRAAPSLFPRDTTRSLWIPV